MVKTIVGGVTVSWGDYKTKDMWVAIFCYIMITVLAPKWIKQIIRFIEYLMPKFQRIINADIMQ